MGLEKYLRNNAARVDAELERFFPKKITRKWLDSALGEPTFVHDAQAATEAAAKPVWDLLGRGGKRWRPALMLLCCEAVGGNAGEIFEFVVMPELIHNGTIMADDIEDKAELRRGKPCTHLLFGEDLAINDANLLYYLPMILLYNNPKKLGAETKARIYDAYSQEMLRLSFGQATDIYWHKGRTQGITEEQYLQMCSYKTGTLARLAAKLGAILGHATEAQIESLGRFATAIGVAFQIQDDILNLMPSKKWGKEFAEDIKEGKRTLIIIHALKNADKRHRARLLEILGAPKKDSKMVLEALEIIKKNGSIGYAKKRAEELLEAGWKEIECVLPESDAKKQLKEFAAYLINRNI